METAVKPRTQINIKFKGLAICFLREPPWTNDIDWNVVFVYDNAHEVELKVAGTTVQLKQGGGDRRVTFHSNGFDNTACQRGELDRLLNLRRLHEREGTGCDLRIKPHRKSGDRNFVWMQVPHSILSVPDTHEVYAARVRPMLGFPRVYDSAKESATLTFYATDDVEVWSSGFLMGDNPQVLATVNVDGSGTAIDVEIDNDCKGRCDHNDFYDLYDFLADRRAVDEVRFLSWPVSQDTEKGTEALKKLLEGGLMHEEVDEYQEILATILTPQYGNCDPIGLDPPPDGP